MVLLGALICLTCFDGLLVLGAFVGCYLFVVVLTCVDFGLRGVAVVLSL